MTATPPPTIWIALLRGINVGGHRKVPMADLASLIAVAGALRPRTYIQSGNVVFWHPEADREVLARDLETRIAAAFGFAVPVVLRTLSELHTAVAASPFLARGEDSEALYLGFLSRQPEPARVDSLDPRRGAPDEFGVVGSDVHILIRGSFATTKLSNAWFDSRLAAVCTVRNWRTVQALIGLATSL